MRLPRGAWPPAYALPHCWVSSARRPEGRGSRSQLGSSASQSARLGGVALRGVAAWSKKFFLIAEAGP